MSEPAVAQGLQEAMGSIANASRGSGQSRQSTGPAPASAGNPFGGLGALIQGLSPMMQQLGVSSSGQPQHGGSQGAMRNAPSGSDDWQSALAELDEEEKAEWETIIRCWLNVLLCLCTSGIAFVISHSNTDILNSLRKFEYIAVFAATWSMTTENR